MRHSTEFDPRRYHTRGGVEIFRTTEQADPKESVESIIDLLNEHRGVLLASYYEYPGRYTRWDLGFIDPPLAVTARGPAFRIEALNERGSLLLLAIAPEISSCCSVKSDETGISGTVERGKTRFSEEERSKQPSIFSVLRLLREIFFSPDDEHLGMYGAFGYDLAFQFDPIEFHLQRPAEQRDLVAYIPDRLVVVDHAAKLALRHSYEFTVEGRSTHQIARSGVINKFKPGTGHAAAFDHQPGEYAALVTEAKKWFSRGDLFEVVPSQTYRTPLTSLPSDVFRRLRSRNPAPYASLMNLGDDEYLIGASPEMFVRVEGKRVETCPISGTIARGDDALSDADRIRELLNSDKDASELTMCTDVDRNDKSRICEPGSVRVIGRRLIEMYSRLIHTVDHVEGILRDGFDALDAFLTHMWAVTVTGAPKLWAMRFIEKHEKSPRVWYGGAIGQIGFDGNIKTGLTLRTIRVKNGTAEVRVGATLLYDSDPHAEEEETRLKASALVDAITRAADKPAAAVADNQARPGSGKRVLLVDHEDSFVHTLANYLRQTGAEVTTVRNTSVEAEIDRLKPHLVVLSPGPGSPADFRLSETISLAEKNRLPVFGVCLGLQGMVEHFGGKLAVLPVPRHGKTSKIAVLGGRLFSGLQQTFEAGRYHSLYAVEGDLPQCLRITARSEDGVIMAIEHESLKMAAVQFHPESIMTLKGEAGLELVRNVLRTLAL